ncbi:response regulator receiver domain protein [Bacteriovorax sp. BSW11_IV]|uniref:response regulator transcription factor n=1 Tax=Bacteriovorax sp. BSW11_IV TaxID=1353529 RepID=UPI000389FDDA|nr:response regulator transcription factor [Bacteriovorax sp. BSW11_IV]EQC49155.1 response regulator receiver domain protein [Bacteriovorax sp. BSW11_IV]
MNGMLMDKSIWVLEDDKDCQFVYEQTLDHRYKTKYFSSIADFANAMDSSENKPSMIIADLMLDDGNFLNYLTNSDESSVLNTPFIIVSSIDDIDALRFCFKEGALDYLTKPFKKNELVVKVENVLSGAQRQRFEIEGASKSVMLDGKEVKNLTSKQKQLLHLFMDSPGRCISRNDILEKVWESTNVHPKTVDVHLYNLRRKLHDLGYMIRSDGGGKWSLLSDRI